MIRTTVTFILAAAFTFGIAGNGTAAPHNIHHGYPIWVVTTENGSMTFRSWQDATRYEQQVLMQDPFEEITIQGHKGA